MSGNGVKKRVVMARTLLARLQQRGIPLLSFVVFGSTASGKLKQDSDVDVLIIVKQKNKRIWRAIVEESAAIEDLSPPLFSLIYTTEEKLREDPLILLDMTKESIVLFDPQGIFQILIEEFKQVLKNLGARRRWLDENTWYWDLKPDWKPGESVEIKI